jgi:hypothetical protein
MSVFDLPLEVRPQFRARRILPCFMVALFCISGCANAPIADGPLGEVDFERWSVHVLTWDDDGDPRKTRVWIAAVQGTPYLRTLQTKWWANIERGSNVQIQSGDYVYPVSIERIDDPSMRIEIDVAFSAKYGWLGKLAIDDRRAESDDPYMALIRVPQN